MRLVHCYTKGRFNTLLELFPNAHLLVNGENLQADWGKVGYFQASENCSFWVFPLKQFDWKIEAVTEAGFTLGDLTFLSNPPNDPTDESYYNDLKNRFSGIPSISELRRKQKVEELLEKLKKVETDLVELIPHGISVGSPIQIQHQVESILGDLRAINFYGEDWCEE